MPGKEKPAVEEATDTAKKFKGRKPTRGHRRVEGKPSMGNDFSYWNKFPELTKSAAQFPVNAIPGTAFIVEDQSNKINLPNVCVVEYAPSIGRCEKVTDPFNVFARQLWLDMHRKYRGLGAYQAPDLGIFIVCTMDIYVLIAELERIYGIYNSYTPANRIRPRGVLNAMGYSTAFLNSVENNLADFKYGINRLIMKAHQLCLPKGISALANQLGMSGFLYADSKSKRASVIAFQRKYFFEYDASSDSNGGIAKYTKLDRSSLTTYQNLLDYADNKLNILLGDDDIARMCSDLLAAYGDGGVDMMTPMNGDWAVIPTYDESILHKFHNIDTNFRALYEYDKDIGTPILDGTFASAKATAKDPLGIIEQDPNTGCVLFKPFFVPRTGAAATLSRANTGTEFYVLDANFEATSGTLAQANLNGHIKPKGGKFLFDSWLEEPTDDVKFEGLLWKQTVIGHSMLNTTTSKYFAIAEISAATEIITSFTVHQVTGGVSVSSQVATSNESLFDSPTDLSVSQLFNSLIDWSPIKFTTGNHLDDGDYRSYGYTAVYGDLDNYATVGKSVVEKVRDAALLSAYKVDIGVKGQE